MPKKRKTKSDKDMIYIEFYDPTFNSGWSKPEDYPKLDHAVCIAVGLIVEENKKKILVAQAKGKHDKQDKDTTVLNPLIILKSQIKESTRFTRADLKK